MPRCRRFWIPIGMLCVSAGSAAAQPAQSPITLSWDVPAGPECPSGDAVSAEVERLLGGKPSTSTGRQLFARARVGREENGQWKLTLRTIVAGTGEEADGERILYGPSCEGLGGAAALIIALGFDPAAVAARAERDASAPAKPGAKDAVVPPAAPRAEPAPVPPPAAPKANPRPPAPAPAASSSRVRLGLGVGVGADAGIFATPAAAAQGSGSLRYGKLELRGTLSYHPPHPIPMNRPAGGMFSLIGGALAVCGEAQSWRAGSVALAGCGWANLGKMRAAGYGVRSPGQAEAWWFAPGAGGALAVELPGAVVFRLDAGLAVPITRVRFVLENVGMVHQPSDVCGHAGLGLDFYFF